MKREQKIIKKLTKSVGALLALHLRVGTKNAVVTREADKVGLITVLDSKAGSTPLNLGLNFTKFNEVKKV